MANERAPGQKLIPIPASEDFIKELNLGFKKAGYDNRSQFVRDAIIEKLESMGIVIPKSLALAPDRIGKGGSRANYPSLSRTGAPAMNESSSASEIGKRIVEQGVSYVEQHAPAKAARSKKAHRKAKVVPPPATPSSGPSDRSL